MAAKHKRADEIFEALKKPMGQAIIRLRGLMSQEELASKAKMDPSTLRRLEKGTGKFREDYINGICSALALKIEDLLRSTADCYEQERKEQMPSYQQMSSEELLQTLRRARDARARLEQQLSDIDLEIKRRQISRAEGLPTTSPQLLS